MNKETFYLITMMINMALGAYAISRKRWWMAYLCTFSLIWSFVWYIEIAWKLK